MLNNTRVNNKKQKNKKTKKHTYIHKTQQQTKNIKKKETKTTKMNK